MEPFQIAGLAVGLVVIAAAAATALRDKLGFPHVIVFAIGAVLAGVPYIHIGTPDGGSVDIGAVKQAAADNTAAAAAQLDAIAKINARLDKLADAVGTLGATVQTAAVQASPTAAQTTAPGAAALHAQLAALRQSGLDAVISLNRSRSFNASAARRLDLTAGGAPQGPGR